LIFESCGSWGDVLRFSPDLMSLQMLQARAVLRRFFCAGIIKKERAYVEKMRRGISAKLSIKMLIVSVNKEISDSHFLVALGFLGNHMSFFPFYLQKFCLDFFVGWDRSLLHKAASLIVKKRGFDILDDVTTIRRLKFSTSSLRRIILRMALVFIVPAAMDAS
jgi:hypothetical protein